MNLRVGTREKSPANVFRGTDDRRKCVEGSTLCHIFISGLLEIDRPFNGSRRRTASSGKDDLRKNPVESLRPTSENRSIVFFRNTVPDSPRSGVIFSALDCTRSARKDGKWFRKYSGNFEYFLRSFVTRKPRYVGYTFMVNFLFVLPRRFIPRSTRSYVLVSSRTTKRRKPTRFDKVSTGGARTGRARRCG